MDDPKGKMIAVDPLGRKLFLADTHEVEQLRESMDRLLLSIGEYMGWEGDISHVFVSDMSTLGDFGLEDSEVAALSKTLGFEVRPGDYLKDIALRMKPAN